MLEATHTAGDMRKHERRTRGLHQNWWFWTAIGVVVVLIACVAWIGFRALQARSDLEAAQAQIGTLKTQVTDFDLVNATKTLNSITAKTSSAVELTSDPVWRAAERIPGLGRNLTAVREIAGVTNDVITKVARPLIKVADGINPASLAPKDGAINLKPFIDAIPAVAQANTGTKEALANIAAIDTDGTVSQVSAAAKKISGLLSGIAPTMETLNSVLPLLPPAMGSDSPRTYVIMFQNNAESRSLGGTALSFAVLKMDKGKINLESTVPASRGEFQHYTTPVISLPDGASDLYSGILGTFVANATARPSFTTAAEITQEMWQKSFGYSVDGVFSIDPIALSYVLRATQPITLPSGDVLNDQTLVPLLLNGLYQRFNSGDPAADNEAEDVIYGQAVSATFGALTGGALDVKKLVPALLQGWDEHRLLFWSAHPDEEKELAKIGLNGELPVSTAKTDQVGVYIQDNVGSKLNYYLRQSIELGSASCRADGKQSYRVGLAMTNSIDPSIVKTLTPSVVGNWQIEGLKKAVQREIVYVYAPPGAQITGVSLNGAAVGFDQMHDGNYPVARVTVTIAPGASVKLEYDIVTATVGKRTLEVQSTPMVTPTNVANVPLDCGTVTAK